MLIGYAEETTNKAVLKIGIKKLTKNLLKRQIGSKEGQLPLGWLLLGATGAQSNLCFVLLPYELTDAIDTLTLSWRTMSMFDSPK